MVYLLLLPVLFIVIFIAGGMIISEPGYTGPASDHFNGKRFSNHDNIKPRGFLDLVRWMVSRRKTKWHPSSVLLQSVPDPNFHQGIKVTFVNHSTFLIQIGSLNILTDPVWSERASPFNWIGPKRMRPPGIDISTLPPIHFILLSHNHYDHLDIQTLKRIDAEHHPRIFCPLGVNEFLIRQNILSGGELDWWQEIEIEGGHVLKSVPAQHFSGRGTLDRDKTLWCGFILTSQFGRLYFAGDTGYNTKLFRTIRERVGEIDLSLIPIGAYKPEWFMSPIHCSPAEAVQIHLDVGSKKSIATHFGTFPLADEGQHEPVEVLLKTLKENSLDERSFFALREGESYLLK